MTLFLPKVARIQLQIQETLQRQYSHHSSVQDAVSQLDAELMDITKVVRNFSVLNVNLLHLGIKGACTAKNDLMLTIKTERLFSIPCLRVFMLA